MRNTFKKIWSEKKQRKRPLERNKRRLEDKGESTGRGIEPVMSCCEHGSEFLKRRGISRLDERLSPASQEGICSMGKSCGSWYIHVPDNLHKTIYWIGDLL
jgi:hypothetical protein